MLLARHRKQGGYYAVKVLQKQAIVKHKEVIYTCLSVCLCVLARVHSLLCLQQRHVMSERSVLLKGLQHPFLVGLHFSFQTPNMLYFVLDYVNGGEVCVDKKFLKRHSYVTLFCLTSHVYFSVAFLPSSEGGVISWTQISLLRCRDGHGTRLPPLPGHCLQACVCVVITII